MLSSLTIRHYAIIDELELEFSNGLTALTGETGAGKSILLGALGLVLGDRADTDSIKEDCSDAEISAEFLIDSLPDVKQWLAAGELDADGDCLLRRRVSRDGRSRAWINGTPVNIQKLREIGALLIDIHGQHEHQSLMKTHLQRQLLDDFANHKNLLVSVQDACTELHKIGRHLQQLEADNSDRENRIDLLRFQTRELDALALQEGEYEELDRRHACLANVEKIATTLHAALEALTDNEEVNAASLLGQQVSAVEQVAGFDDRIRAACDLMQDSLVQMEDAAVQLRHYAENLDMDNSELAAVEQRIQEVLDLSRKHRVEPAELPSLHAKLVAELDEITHADEHLEQLRQQHAQLSGDYLAAAEKLHHSRVDAALKLDKGITAAMQKLGMKGGRFHIQVEKNDSAPSVHGNDDVVFTVSTNAGQGCKPLAKIASGGELARISLAIQMMTARQCRIPVLVFDEVDSGVGGGIAEIVGQQLRTLGVGRQVVCITHLPQVASQAHQHMRVEKSGDAAQTRVYSLQPAERIHEIARMLSGVEITDQSIAHAEEMITRASAG